MSKGSGGTRASSPRGAASAGGATSAELTQARSRYDAARQELERAERQATDTFEEARSYTNYAQQRYNEIRKVPTVTPEQLDVARRVVEDAYGNEKRVRAEMDARVREVENRLDAERARLRRAELRATTPKQHG